MQTQEMHTDEGHGTTGFAMPQRCSRSAPAVGSEVQIPTGAQTVRTDKTCLHPENPSGEGWAKGSNGSTYSLRGKDQGWRQAGPSDCKETKDLTTFMKDYGPYRSNAETDWKTSQKPPPPRLPRHARSHPNDVQLALLSPVANSTIPSPLASPITATANSLTALSISQTSPHAALSGRDQTRITVPRERTTRTRPYSIASADSLIAQERRLGNQGDDSHHDQSGRLSDPETSRRIEQNGQRSTKQTGKLSFKAVSSASKPISSTAATNKSVDLKSPSLKPAAQLRVTLHNLVSTGILPTDTLVVFREHSAYVTAKGTLIPEIKDPEAATRCPWLQIEYETPSAWATAMAKGARTGKVAVNGWSAIKVPIEHLPEIYLPPDSQDVTEVSLDVLRKRYLADLTEDNSAQPGDDSAQARADKGSAALERKKRKRQVVTRAEPPELRITTQTGATGQKGTSTTVRPRKRTMSDLSGMVYSDLIQDRQLHLEAAGALFSMQDPFSSPTFESFGRRDSRAQPSRQKPHRNRRSIQLESVARHRQEQELTWSYYSSGRASALRMLKPLLLVPVAIPWSPSSNLEQGEFCALCGTSGHTAESECFKQDYETATTLNMNAARAAMHRCFDCGEFYHLNCTPFDSQTSQELSSASDQSWRCPRCTICTCCSKSIHEAPPSLGVSDKTSEQPEKVMASKEILVLTCDKCRALVHLECQSKSEPGLEDVVGPGTSRDMVEWTCLACRECVECGHRVRARTDDGTTENDAEMASELNLAGVIEDRWSNGFALCPACTVLEESGNVCPLCCRTYQEDDYETPMIFCDGCSHWVHVACDKGLQDGDYEEMGEDSRQYFCPSCIPTPIPSPTHSSSSSMISAVNSVEQSPWQRPYGSGLHRMDGSQDYSRGASSSNEDDWHYRGRIRKDDILDLIKAAKEISESESQGNSPYIPKFASTHSRTMSASLESVAEAAAAEALLTIFSGASTPVSSTPYASYPPSPYEPSFNALHDRPQDLPPLIRSIVFTPSTSDQESSSSLRECQGTPNCHCLIHRQSSHVADYFNSRLNSRPSVPYYQIGQELNLRDTKSSRQETTILSGDDVTMEDVRVGYTDAMASSIKGFETQFKNEIQTSLYQPLQFTTPSLQEAKSGFEALHSRDLLVAAQSRSGSATVEDLDIRAGGWQRAFIQQDMGAATSFRIGRLIVHSTGSFDSPGGIHCETGLPNDIDVAIKYRKEGGKDLRLRQGEELLALPLGYKCERELLRENSSRCSVIAEIVQRGAADDPPSNAMPAEAFAPVSEKVEDLEIVWRITLRMLDSSSGDARGDRVFYCESMRDAVDAIFLPFDAELTDPAYSFKHDRLYLKSPSTFFGVDHPMIRLRIQSMDGAGDVASRMWQRYREGQRALERQCSKHGCNINVSQGAAGKHGHSPEHLDSMSAARARSRPESRLWRRRVARIGIALSGEDGSAHIKNRETGVSLMPGLSQDLTKTGVISSAMSSPFPFSEEDQQLRDRIRRYQCAAAEQISELHSEQSINVAVYWNGRKMATNANYASQSLGQRKDSAISGHDESDKEGAGNIPVSDLRKNGEIAMDLDSIVGLKPRVAATVPLPAEQEPLPVHADMRLYTARAFEQDEMILEYVGELVSPTVAVRRQEVYQSQGRNCFMMWCEFQDVVIDASIQGGLARHIRGFDCMSDIGTEKNKQWSGSRSASVYARIMRTAMSASSPKVVICASRNLNTGEELTMRYCS